MSLLQRTWIVENLTGEAVSFTHEGRSITLAPGARVELTGIGLSDRDEVKSLIEAGKIRVEQT